MNNSIYNKALPYKKHIQPNPKSRASLYAKRPNIRKEFKTELEYLNFLVRDKYTENVTNTNNPDRQDIFKEWSENQLKILYILYEYSFKKKIQEEKERQQHTYEATKTDKTNDISIPTTSGTNDNKKQLLGYIRQVPLYVMLYEGVTHQVLDYDYSPRLEKFGTTYLYLNISREATSDIELLRQAGLVDMLMVTTIDSTESRAYCLSTKGFKFINKINLEYEMVFKQDEIPLKKIKRDIELILYPPGYDRKDGTSYLLQPFWDAKLNKFTIVNENVII